MNKLISSLRVVGVSECLLSEIETSYSVSDKVVVGVSSLDMVSSMVVKSLSECDSDLEVKSLAKARKSSLKVSNSKSKKVSKSKSVEEEALDKMCSEAFNDTSAANGVSVLDVSVPVVKLSKVKLSAEEKAVAKAAAIAAKAEAKAAVIASKAAEKLKAKEDALLAKAAEKAQAIAAKAEAKAKAKEEKSKESKAAKAEALKAEKEAKTAALKAEKDALKVAKAEALKAEKAAKAEALKAEKDALKKAEKEALKAQKDALKSEKTSEKKKSKKVEEVVAVVEVEEEPDVVKRFEFEGVKYLKSKNTGIIYNMEKDVIGKWTESAQKIDFNTEDGEEEEEDYDN